MWLAETAVDSETLDLLAQNGILFTVLAPHQCARVQELPKDPLPDPLDGTIPPIDHWMDTANASVNPNHPYLVRLKEGRTITVFFYNGPISRAIAFEGVLNNGETFAWRLASRPRWQQPRTADGARGHRWRKLWPPPSPRGNGTLLRLKVH